jgi:redox-sensitive bicupin YhaK (pirin superfamily)
MRGIIMQSLIESKQMGRSNLGWLDSHFHFSFAEYYDPGNIRFGTLRVFNDDQVKPGTGFPPHSHADMEIISYVVEGELTHADSMGNMESLKPGQVQYLCAGTGVTHSEYNYGNTLLRFVQIWILPDREGYPPNYERHRVSSSKKKNEWQPIATGYFNETNDAPIKIHQDVDMYVTCLGAGKSLDFKVHTNRQAYLVLLSGKAEVNGITMTERDALESIEEDLSLTALEKSHFILLEMALD